MGGHVNRALLESYYQNPGDTYQDNMTEGAMEVIAQQVDDNWDDHEAHRTAAEIDHPDGSITNRKIRDGTITANKFVPGALTNDTQNALRITQLESNRVKKSGDTMTGPLNISGAAIYPQLPDNIPNSNTPAEINNGFGLSTFTSAAGYPAGIGGLISFKRGTARIMQLIYSADNDNDNKVFLRTGNSSGAWKDWEQIITTEKVKFGIGSPEGSVTSPIGSIFLRVDGGEGTTLYVKESGTGNTGWKAVQTA